MFFWVWNCSEGWEDLARKCKVHLSGSGFQPTTYNPTCIGRLCYQSFWVVLFCRFVYRMFVKVSISYTRLKYLHLFVVWWNTIFHIFTDSPRLGCPIAANMLLGNRCVFKEYVIEWELESQLLGNQCFVGFTHERLRWFLNQKTNKNPNVIFESGI